MSQVLVLELISPKIKLRFSQLKICILWFTIVNKWKQFMIFNLDTKDKSGWVPVEIEFGYKG